MNSSQTLESSITNPLIFAVASATSPPIIRRSIEIITRIWMALGAMSLASVLCRWGLSAQDVDAHGNGLQVRWPDTMTNAALVIDSEAIRDWADKKLVSVAMGWDIVACEPEEAITFGALNGRPEPAGISLLYLSPETLFGNHVSV